ncbi:hypothetical protein [Bacillus sp. TE9122W]
MLNIPEATVTLPKGKSALVANAMPAALLSCVYPQLSVLPVKREKYSPEGNNSFGGKNEKQRSKTKMKIKKNTLHLPKFIAFEHDGVRGLCIADNKRKNLSKLFDDLVQYELGKPIDSNVLDWLTEFKVIENELIEGSNEYFIFDKYFLDDGLFSKINYFMAFKNGTVIIDFNSSEFAIEFVNTYLNQGDPA